MKLLFNLFAFCLLAFTGFGQNYKEKKDKSIKEVIESLPVENETVVFEKAFEIKSLPKDVIFDRLREWNVGAFMDYKKSIKIDDKPTGIIVSQMVSRVYKRAAIISFSGQISFTVSLVARDGKYNCKLSDFHLITNSNDTKSYNDLFREEERRKFTKSELAIIKETGMICDAVAKSIFDKVLARSATEF